MEAASGESVQSELQKILSSAVFSRSDRLSRFLRYVVERSLDGAQDNLKEYRIGVDVFDRGDNFDPRIDNIVRSHAHRLRTVLAGYYEHEGSGDAVVIALPKGSYVPVFQIRESAALAVPEPATLAEPARLFPWKISTLLAGAVALGALVAWLAVRPRAAPGSAAPMELTLGMSPELRIDNGVGALSPDATQLVFPGQDASGVPRLWVRLLRSTNARSLPGTEGASYPFWSPDGKSIAFFSAHKLKRMRMPDGPVQVIADAPMGRGGDWGQDGVILFSPQTADVLFQVPETGGPVRPATQLNAARQETAHRWPFFLPGGKDFLYDARSGVGGESGFCFASLGSMVATRMFAQDPMSNAVMARVPGSDRAYLLYVRNGNLLAQRFDAGAKRVSGNPATIATGLPVPSAGSPFAVAGNLLVYTRARRSAPASLTWYSISGQPLGSAGPTGDYSAIGISPDGSLVAFERLEEQYGTFDIWTLDLGRGILNRITSDPANDLSPVWSPDSRALVYSSERTGTGKLARKDLSGGPAVERFVKTCCAQTPSDWTRSGILFADDHAKTHLDVALFDPARSGAGAVPIAAGPANERNGRMSPDGALVAYESDRTGGTEIHVRPRDPVAGDAQDVQASSHGGIRPRWSMDGKRIYYLASLQIILSVDVERSAGRFTLGTPRELFRVPGGRISSYALHPDGRRFLIASPAGPPPSPQLTVLWNWFSDLP